MRAEASQDGRRARASARRRPGAGRRSNEGRTKTKKGRTKKTEEEEDRGHKSVRKNDRERNEVRVVNGDVMVDGSGDSMRQWSLRLAGRGSKMECWIGDRDGGWGIL